MCSSGQVCLCVPGFVWPAGQDHYLYWQEVHRGIVQDSPWEIPASFNQRWLNDFKESPQGGLERQEVGNSENSLAAALKCHFSLAWIVPVIPFTSTGNVPQREHLPGSDLIAAGRTLEWVTAAPESAGTWTFDLRRDLGALSCTRVVTLCLWSVWLEIFCHQVSSEFSEPMICKFPLKPNHPVLLWLCFVLSGLWAPSCHLHSLPKSSCRAASPQARYGSEHIPCKQIPVRIWCGSSCHTDLACVTTEKDKYWCWCLKLLLVMVEKGSNISALGISFFFLQSWLTEFRISHLCDVLTGFLHKFWYLLGNPPNEYLKGTNSSFHLL